MLIRDYCGNNNMDEWMQKHTHMIYKHVGNGGENLANCYNRKYHLE